MARDSDRIKLLTLAEIDRGECGASTRPPGGDRQTLSVLRDWIGSYLMQSHPKLGRSGDVCPFTRQGVKIGAFRVGVSGAASGDAGIIKAQLARVFENFENIPCMNHEKNYRAIIVAFPNCAGEKGIETLRKAMRTFRLKSVLRGRMIALFHESAEERGLWNPEFRPLRSPVPLFVIRSLVSQDAPFAAKQPLLAPKYIARFSYAGMKRIMSIFKNRIGKTMQAAKS